MDPTFKKQSKVYVAKKQPFKSRDRQNFGGDLQCYNSPAARARKLFKPSMDSAILLYEIEKKIFCFGLEVLRGHVTSGAVFAFFGLFFAALDANPVSQFFRSVFFETRLSSETLEPLIGFLPYLEPELCHKKQKVVKISTPAKENLG